MFKNQGRRAMDRFPLSERMGWILANQVDRIKASAATILGSIVVGCFLSFLVLIAAVAIRA